MMVPIAINAPPIQSHRIMGLTNTRRTTRDASDDGGFVPSKRHRRATDATSAPLREAIDVG